MQFAHLDAQAAQQQQLQDRANARIVVNDYAACGNAHNLFVQSSWTGADLHSLVAQELSPYSQDGEARAQIDGDHVLLEPSSAQAVAVVRA